MGIEEYDMEAINQIRKTREYLDYLEEHILNVEKAWGVVKEHCKDMRFIHDDLFYFNLDNAIEHHDLSKLSENEFTQYRDCFYPLYDEGKKPLGDAWEHHKINNPHHWETWTHTPVWCHPDDWEINCAHMVIDWMAMSYKFGDTAKQYYEKNKDKIKIPDYSVKFIYEIFDRIYG